MRVCVRVRARACERVSMRLFRVREGTQTVRVCVGAHACARVCVCVHVYVYVQLCVCALKVTPPVGGLDMYSAARNMASISCGSSALPVPGAPTGALVGLAATAVWVCRAWVWVCGYVGVGVLVCGCGCAGECEPYNTPLSRDSTIAWTSSLGVAAISAAAASI